MALIQYRDDKAEPDKRWVLANSETGEIIGWSSTMTIHVEHRGSAPQIADKRRIDAEIVRRYAHGESVSDLYAAFGVSYDRVKAAIVAGGGRLRTVGEAQKIAWNKRKHAA